MMQDGQIVLFAFPYTDQTSGQMRPALVLRRLPGLHEDHLICMISSQLRQEIIGVDEVVSESDSDFADTGLKLPSLIRVTRLAVVSADVLQGAIGTLGEERLARIRGRIADWIAGTLDKTRGERVVASDNG